MAFQQFGFAIIEGALAQPVPIGGSTKIGMLSRMSKSSPLRPIRGRLLGPLALVPLVADYVETIKWTKQVGTEPNAKYWSTACMCSCPETSVPTFNGHAYIHTNGANCTRVVTTLASVMATRPPISDPISAASLYSVAHYDTRYPSNVIRENARVWSRRVGAPIPTPVFQTVAPVVWPVPLPQPLAVPLVFADVWNPNLVKLMPPTPQPVAQPAPSIDPATGLQLGVSPIIDALVRGDTIQWQAVISPTGTPPLPPLPPQPVGKQPPRKGEKEPPKKKGKKGPVGAFLNALDKISEGAEIIDALFEALPKKVQNEAAKGHGKRGLLDNAGQYGIDGADWKIAAIWEHASEIDVGEFMKNVVANEIQDSVLGNIHKNLPPQSGKAVEPGMKEVNKAIEDGLSALGF